MSFYIDAQGRKHEVPVTMALYQEAKEQGISLAQLVNTKFAEAGAEPDLKLGTVFQQVSASEGLVIVGENPFGQRSPYLQDIFEGKSGYNAATTTTDRSAPYGTQARTLFPAAVIEMIEDSMQPDRTTDSAMFDKMVKMRQSINSDSYIQPVISYKGANRGGDTGVNAPKAQRIAELSLTPMMLMLGTSEKIRTVPTYGIGIEVSEKAMKATTLDMMVLTVNRYTQIEKDARVYQYLSDIFLGDVDHNSGAVPAVTSTSLDSAATGGVLTHKAWVKFLALKRKTRKLTHIICDIDTYLKIEGRTGRPGSNNYDPTLERVDPQARPMNNNGFANDVVYMIVDSAAEGGPIPAGEVWALDKDNGILMVRNASADFKATEDFVLRRSSAMVWHWGELALRMWGDAELTPFVRLQIL